SVDEALARNIDVRYFPNPTNGLLNIEINGLENEETELAVLNLHGQVLLQEHLGALPSNFRKSIDLSGQAQGIYFIRLKTATRSQVDRVAVQ
ncbi:MAG: T9SS type A sorting domain-containing protein, partial [Bacteroidota bacterium]